jgi:hypothetical protein
MTMIDEKNPGEPSGQDLVEQLKASGQLDALFAQIDAGGVELTGDGGFVPALVKAALERGLQAELTSHLGYEKGSSEAPKHANSRNGTTPKTVESEVGPIELDVPRDRGGSFTPRLVPKGQRRLGGLDEDRLGRGRDHGSIAPRRRLDGDGVLDRLLFELVELNEVSERRLGAEHGGVFALRGAGHGIPPASAWTAAGSGWRTSAFASMISGAGSARVWRLAIAAETRPLLVAGAGNAGASSSPSSLSRSASRISAISTVSGTVPPSSSLRIALLRAIAA